MKTSYVLIVDDQVINRVVLKEDFAKLYNVLEAENGKQAVALIQEKGSEIDLILLDLIMPESDGFYVLDYLKESRKDADIPVFVVTADDSPETFKRVENYAVADLISKPFMPKIIVRRARNVITLYERKRKEMEEYRQIIQELNEENASLRDRVKDYEKKLRNITKQLSFD